MSVLLTPDDVPPFTILRETKRRPYVFICEHGGNNVPASLDQLGLNDAELSRHIGIDIGVARVTELLAKNLGAAAVIANISRLVIDVNRALDDPTLIPEVSDGTIIPANQKLSARDRELRVGEIFDPYHKAVEKVIERVGRTTPKVAVISIHSFTPQLLDKGTPRPWQIGILWRHDGQSAQSIIDFLRQNTALTIGDNEPYSMVKDACYTIDTHAEEKNRPGFLIEIRQDEIADEAGQQAYAAILADFFETFQPI